VGKINIGFSVEGSICVLVVDVLDHGLIIVSSKLLIVVIHLHPRSSPGSYTRHVSTYSPASFTAE